MNCVIFTHKKIVLFVIYTFIINCCYSQEPNVILGRPTDTSVTASVIFSQNTICFLEYGSEPALLLQQTPDRSCKANMPEELDITGLDADRRYYYRVAYKAGNGTVVDRTPVYTFHTQRAPGKEFVFTIEADEHLYDKKGIDNMYRVCLDNQALDKPDFMISLGDIFGDDHEWNTITSEEVQSLHRNYRPFLGRICHSVPFFVCLGNHEGENDYYYAQNPGNNLCVWGTYWRKYYFPNPYPNGFYTGNTDVEPYDIGNPENYYAWTWGDALFVVLDVYRDQGESSAKPQKWAWSLGRPQYDWLRNVLETSTARHKLVFAHHVRGQGRGGAEEAVSFEWGGYDGSTYKFDQFRPGWGKPVHQLFVDNGVDIFFQGHDHLFAREDLDGVVYQTCPMPSDSTYKIGILANASAFVSDTLDGTGHLRVTVSPECVKVDYVKAFLPKDTLSGVHKNREVAFTYSTGSCGSSAADESSADDVITVYPNPTVNVLKVSGADMGSGTGLSIYNLLGNLLLEAQGNAVDVSELQEGMYVMALISKGKRILRKFVIKR